MVRIVEPSPSNQKGTPKLNKQEVAIFRLVGIAIADQPQKLKSLLAAHGIDVPEKPKGSELTEATIYAISQNNKAFNKQLAELLADQVVPDENDSFNTKDLAGAAEGTNVTVGSDPVSAIAGAIGSIFSFAGNLSNRKAQKEQARKESMMSLMMMNNQQEQMAANQQMQVNANASKTKIIKIVGVIGLIALLGGLFIWQMNKNKAVVQPQTS